MTLLIFVAGLLALIAGAQAFASHADGEGRGLSVGLEL